MLNLHRLFLKLLGFKMAASNMNKKVGPIKSYLYTKIGISLTRSDAQAGVARYYYNYDYKYCEK